MEPATRHCFQDENGRHIAATIDPAGIMERCESQEAMTLTCDLPRLMIVLPHLRAGGIERSAVLLANGLHRRRALVRMVLSRAVGPLLGDLDPDIDIAELPGTRARASVFALSRHLRRCDIVYSGTNARNLACLAARSLIAPSRRPPVLISEHTSPAAYLADAKWKGLRRRAMRWLYPQAAALLAPSLPLAQDWLDHLGLDQPQPLGQLNPVLSAQAVRLSDQIAAGQGPARDPSRMLSVGRLHPVKGHDLAIRAIARVNDLHLRILGEGAQRPKLMALAQDLGVADRVEMPGHVGDVAREMAQAGLLIVPSRREGFGNVIVEAMATQTPVLATDCDGPRRLISAAPGAGRIVPVEDTEALAAALMEMTLSAKTRDETAVRHARDLALSYSAEAATEQFADTMDRVLAQTSKH